MSSLSNTADAVKEEFYKKIAHANLEEHHNSDVWKQVADTVHGWQKAWAMVKHIIKVANEQCSGRRSLSGGCCRSYDHIMYEWRCPFWNSHSCSWECRFFIAHSCSIHGPEKDVTKRAFHHRAHAICDEMHPALAHPTTPPDNRTTHPSQSEAKRHSQSPQT